MRIRTSFIIFISTLLLLSCGKSAEELLLEAEKYDEIGQYEKGIELLNQAIEKDPEYLGAYINRGAYKSSLKNYESAISDYQKVLELDSKNTLATYNIGNSYRQSGNLKKAKEFYDLAFQTKGGELITIDYEPNSFIEKSLYDVPSAEIYYNRGLVHYDLLNYEKAYADFNNSLKNDSEPADNYYMIGSCLLMTGNTELACEQYKKAMELGDEMAKSEFEKHCGK
ncbi:MAG: tetratricopeptide repeat protein [Planctomycetes bacterium]|nr:tetratricopeptide repeat protein [Planctomycetota bacterium]